MGSVMEFMLDQVPHMILQWDEEGNMTYSNSLWREFTGHTDKASPWSHYVHLEDSTNWSRWGKVDAPYFTECRIRRHSDGGFIWHKVRSYLMEIESKVCHIRIATDIHNDKLIATQLNESRAREDVYHQLLASSSDPIVTFDARSGMVVNLNRSAEREFQYPAVELVGRSFNVLVPKSFTCGGPVGRLAKIIKSHKRGNMVTMGGSDPIHVVCRNGEQLPVTLSVAEFLVDSQELCVATLSIVTKALNHQEELRSSKDSFLRTMSHELRTPLFGLLGTLSTILEDNPSISSSPSEEGLDLIRSESSSPVPPPQSPRSPPFVPTTILSELGLRSSSGTNSDEISPSLSKKYPHKNAELRQMESCTRSLLSVVNNMIAYYKIEMGITPLEMPVQFRTLLQEVCGYYESCVTEGVIFTYEVSDTVPLTVISDATLLRHALANLVSNALRFTPKGAVAVVVDVVEPSPSPEQVLLWISIADTGIGIAPEFFSQVFQPFTQMDSSNSRKYGGAGLGLAVCKRVVDLLGGAISFNSGLGLGTVFEISLPVSLQPSNPPEPQKQQQLLQQQKITEERVAHFDVESDPLNLRPASPLHTPTSSPRVPISSSPLATSYTPTSNLTSSSLYELSPSSFYNPFPLSTSASFTSLLNPPPTTYQQQHSQPPSPEIGIQESTENDRRSFSRPNNKFQSALSTIVESDTETNSECEETTKGMSNLGINNRSIPTPDPNSPIEDYSISAISSISYTPVQPETPVTRKSPASAPASPRIHPIINNSPIPSTSRFFRRPSFPFVLDDPSLSLMMTLSPTLSSPSSSSVINSPISSPRSNVQSPVSPPNTASSPLVFPLHMRVLVVDDNLVNQNVLKKMLKHMECIVSTAQHGKDALDILFDSTCAKYVGYSNFDLILMDCQMPVMDGLQATKAIRNWELEKFNKSKIRIVSLSASGASETEKQCYESGSDGFISKPVTLQSLCRVLSDRTLIPTLSV